MSTRVPAVDLVVGDILLDVSREPDYAARILSIEPLPDGRIMFELWFGRDGRWIAPINLVMDPHELRRTTQ